MCPLINGSFTSMQDFILKLRQITDFDVLFLVALLTFRESTDTPCWNQFTVSKGFHHRRAIRTVRGIVTCDPIHWLTSLYYVLVGGGVGVSVFKLLKTPQKCITRHLIHTARSRSLHDHLLLEIFTLKTPSWKYTKIPCLVLA